MFPSGYPRGVFILRGKSCVRCQKTCPLGMPFSFARFCRGMKFPVLLAGNPVMVCLLAGRQHQTMRVPPIAGFSFLPPLAEKKKALHSAKLRVSRLEVICHLF